MARCCRSAMAGASVAIIDKARLNLSVRTHDTAPAPLEHLGDKITLNTIAAAIECTLDVRVLRKRHLDGSADTVARKAVAEVMDNRDVIPWQSACSAPTLLRSNSRWLLACGTPNVPTA
jgi:hypothetical protein